MKNPPENLEMSHKNQICGVDQTKRLLIIKGMNLELLSTIDHQLFSATTLCLDVASLGRVKYEHLHFSIYLSITYII